jgi:transposase-like protein
MLNGIKDIAPLLNDEKKAGEVIEKLRWPEGVRCAHCEHETVYELKGPNPDRKQWKCRACRKKFSVTTNSIFEDFQDVLLKKRR